MTKKKRTKMAKPFLDIIRSDFYKEGVQEGLSKILTHEQLVVTEKLLENTLKNEERWIAYIQGFNANEIGGATGYTRANISARLNNQLGAGKEDADRRHKENRELILDARDWYMYVYLSDQAGDFRQSEQFVPEDLQTDDHLYRLYIQNGGEKLKGTYVDGRHRLSDEKKEIILEELKDHTVERVAFQQRVYIENIERLAVEHNVPLRYEEDMISDPSEREYTQKYERWVNKKKELNRRQVERLKEERRKLNKKRSE